jgi:fumarate hydratase class I
MGGEGLMKSPSVLGEADLFTPPRDTPYRRLDIPPPRQVRSGGRSVLEVPIETLTRLAREAFTETAFSLRPARLEGLTAILADPEASENDRFVAASLIRNAMISAEGRLPLCQDTGTASVFAIRGEDIRTGADDAAALAEGARQAYADHALRHSQMLPRGLFEEVNTDTNLPAQVDIAFAPGSEYRLLFVAKGGGSANKTALFQCSPSQLNEGAFESLLRERINGMGVAACPPYRLALVIGGTSPELNLKAVKLASAGAMDGAPATPGGAFYRDRSWEELLRRLARESNWGAQFGGRYLALDARVIRMARHAASLPVGLGVSCSADRNALARIGSDGVFLEALDHDPGRWADALAAAEAPHARRIDLNRPMADILEQLRACRAGQAVRLNGPMVVARDRAHMILRERLRTGAPLPSYFRDHPICYAGPARTPPGMVTGSFGPTTSSRMDEFMEEFMARGGALVTLGKGHRSPAVRAACRTYGGFYLGTIGGAAALLAREHIAAAEVLDFPELGMEAVRRIVVRDLPAFIVYDPFGGSLYPSV